MANWMICLYTTMSRSLISCPGCSGSSVLALVLENPGIARFPFPEIGNDQQKASIGRS